MQAPWPPSLALNSSQPLVHIGRSEPEQLDPPIPIGPAFDGRNSFDESPQSVSEVHAIQMSQLQSEAEPHGVRLDCQGLKLGTTDRLLHWESLVRLLQTPTVYTSSTAECQFLQDAAVADCRAQAVSGTMLAVCYPLAYF